MTTRPIAAFLCLLAAAASAGAADARLGRDLAATCANCHGTNGHAVPDSSLKPLAGMDKAKLLQAMADFRNGDRPATIMHQIAKGYTPAQLELIASWFATRK